jgi:hypothetical protein
MLENNNVIIYGLKIEDRYHYIGKTICLNHEGNVIKSNLCLYGFPHLRELIFDRQDVQFDVLETVALKKWYDKKLEEVVDKYKDEHPLRNPDWMKEGKRGYWEGTTGYLEEGGYWSGKTRDEHTVLRLAESKFKRIIQFDKNGNLIKIWDSAKEIGLTVFKDYCVKNGSSESRIYNLISALSINGHFGMGCYWYKYEDLHKHFNGNIPKKLNIDAILKKEVERKRESCRNAVQEFKSFYTIEWHKADGSIQYFDNIFHAGYVLKISSVSVSRICRGVIKRPAIDLKYGQKKRQNIRIRDQYPKYKIVALPREKLPRKKVKASKIVYRYVNGIVNERYLSIGEAAEKLGLEPKVIRSICNGKSTDQSLPVLKYGKQHRTYYR